MTIDIRRIPLLPELEAADLDDGDSIVVHDASGLRTRRMVIQKFRTRMQDGVALAATLRAHHTVIAAAQSGSSSPGQSPSPIPNGALLLLGFTLNADDAFRGFKIPTYFDGVNPPTAHVHWSKTTDANESGKAVRWRVSYWVLNGSTDDGAAAPTVVDLDDTYDDAGTTTRIVHRTPNVPLVGLVAGYYLAIKIEAVTPAGTPLAGEPGLFSLDVIWDERINS